MPDYLPHATANVGGHPLHMMLVPIPLACFAGTLITDIAYAATANMQWANFSAWLLAVGLVVAFFAVLAGLIDFLFNRRIRNQRRAWIHGLGYCVALALAIVNSFVHSRDAWTSVVPDGLILSALTILVLLATEWKGWIRLHRGEAQP